MTHIEKELWENSEPLYEQFCHKLRFEGEARGKSEGLREDEARGLRTAVRDLCDILSIPLMDEHEQMLVAFDAAQLESLRLQIKRDRCW